MRPFANNGLLNGDAISRTFFKICAVTIWIVNKNITPGDVRQLFLYSIDTDVKIIFHGLYSKSFL